MSINTLSNPSETGDCCPISAADGAARVSGLLSRMTSFANFLLVSDGKEDLYSNILEIAADLLSACRGSIMLIDRNGEDIHVVSSKGRSADFAGRLKLRVGTGIAGIVAKTGTPLLVSDVEKDLRIAMQNRPHYETKSLISIPLKINEKIIGVLNLSDKMDLVSFNDEDLDLLTLFSILASLLIERTSVMEEACRFEQLSLTDPLTGLFNRRFLNHRIEEELNRSLHQGLEFTLLFIDLDHFKKYNDRFGHLAGDHALKRAAEIIKSAVRCMDVVTRFGGEEFCVLLPGISKQTALVVAERIREGIESENLHSGEELGRLTASLGISTFPEDGSTVTTLLHAADIAAYQAKECGRNRSVAAKPAPVTTQRRIANPGSGSPPASVALATLTHLGAVV